MNELYKSEKTSTQRSPGDDNGWLRKMSLLPYRKEKRMVNEALA